MTELADGETVTLELDRTEALVLFEWLARTEDPEDANDLPPFEQAVLSARWRVEAQLETELHEPFASNYDELLEAAIEDVRQEWYGTG